MTQNKTINEQIEEMENFLLNNKEETMDTRDMSNQLRGFKEGVKRARQECQKMFLEEIKSMRKHKDTKLIHNFDGEEIDYLISAKELKSKIGGEK